MQRKPWQNSIQIDLLRMRILCVAGRNVHFCHNFILNNFFEIYSWTDIYYIPRRFFQDFIYLSDAFHQSRSFHEIGIPTMFNIIDLTYRSTPFHTVITHLEDCWGSCCSYGANANDINTKRCGHKIDLANDQVVKVLINLLNSEASYLHDATPRKSNNKSVWLTYMWRMFGT